MNEIPAMMNVMPSQFPKFMLSPKRKIEDSDIHTKLNDHTGYNRDNSPNFRAMTNRIAANPYAMKPRIMKGSMKESRENPMEVDPSLKDS